MGSNKKLTTVSQKNVTSKVLTSHVNQNVRIVFSDEIEKEYSISKLQEDGKKKLVGFIDRATHMTWTEFEKTYKSVDYQKDCDSHIHHYGSSNGFRIHGYINGVSLIVVRIDPNHSYKN